MLSHCLPLSMGTVGWGAPPCLATVAEPQWGYAQVPRGHRAVCARASKQAHGGLVHHGRMGTMVSSGMSCVRPAWGVQVGGMGRGCHAIRGRGMCVPLLTTAAFCPRNVRSACQLAAF